MGTLAATTLSINSLRGGQTNAVHAFGDGVVHKHHRVTD